MAFWLRRLRNSAVAATALATALPAIVTGAQAQSGDTVEQPAFEVLAERGPMQIRRYEPTIEARLTVDAPSAERAANKAFMRLAGYIFGGNAAGEKIAMTAPVTTQAPAPLAMTAGDGPGGALTGEGRYTVAFTMPSRWSMETLPDPKDTDVRLEPMPERTIAAWRKTGGLDDADTQAALDELMGFVRERGFEPAGAPMRAGYDGPSVPRDQRRNEVMVPVRSTDG